MAKTFVDPFFEADEADEPVLASDLNSAGRRNRHVAKVPWVAGSGEALEPVMIEIKRTCVAKRKPCGLCDKPKTNTVHRKRNAQEGKPFCPYKRQLGCASCGKALGHESHMGAPPTFNIFGSSANPHAWQSMKQSWEAAIYRRLEAAGLPRGLGYCLVEAEVSFGDAIERDQDNHVVVIAKACGDALVEGGWLRKDKWNFYEFGRMQLRETGENLTRLMFFPRWPEESAEMTLPI